MSVYDPLLQACSSEVTLGRTSFTTSGWKLEFLLSFSGRHPVCPIWPLTPDNAELWCHEHRRQPAETSLCRWFWHFHLSPSTSGQMAAKWGECSRSVCTSRGSTRAFSGTNFVLTHKRRWQNHFIHSFMRNVKRSLVSWYLWLRLGVCYVYRYPHCAANPTRVWGFLKLQSKGTGQQTRGAFPERRNFGLDLMIGIFGCRGEKDLVWVQTPAVNRFPNKERRWEGKDTKLALREWTKESQVPVTEK